MAQAPRVAGRLWSRDVQPMSIKSTVKATVATGWDFTSRVRRSPPKLTILYYHAVPAGLAHRFDAQMAYLKANANIVNPDHAGPLDPTRPNVAVTFDDAFRSVREHALPSLVRLQIPTTIFVPTGWMGRSPGWAMETSGDQHEIVMTEEEIRSLPVDLVSIGSHTVDHPRLTTLQEAEGTAQLTSSRTTLEAMLRRQVDTLAFPYGEHNARTIELAVAAGYRHVYTVSPQAIAASGASVSRGRTSADPADSPSLFALKTRGAFDWMPIASRLKKKLRRRS